VYNTSTMFERTRISTLIIVKAAESTSSTATKEEDLGEEREEPEPRLVPLEEEGGEDVVAAA
jgi:hypothetical protein